MSDVRKLNGKHLALVLFLELITVVIIVLCFKWITPKLWAGRWASTTFFIEGLAIAYILWPWKVKAWTLSFPAILLYQFAFVWPITIFRWVSTESLSELNWLGLPGPILHLYSTPFYYGLIGATFLDLLFVLYLKHKKAKK